MLITLTNLEDDSRVQIEKQPLCFRSYNGDIFSWLIRIFILIISANTDLQLSVDLFRQCPLSTTVFDRLLHIKFFLSLQHTRSRRWMVTSTNPCPQLNSFSVMCSSVFICIVYCSKISTIGIILNNCLLI